MDEEHKNTLKILKKEDFENLSDWSLVQWLRFDLSIGHDSVGTF
jgi:hypothetical protein